MKDNARSMMAEDRLADALARAVVMLPVARELVDLVQAPQSEDRYWLDRDVCSTDARAEAVPPRLGAARPEATALIGQRLELMEQTLVHALV
ncbi:MAG: hypothetical protein AAGB05_00455 [Pseudomonadota bacterium]